MPPKNARKRAPKAFNSIPLPNAITLGEEETLIATITPPNPSPVAATVCPLEPLIPTSSRQLLPSNDTQEALPLQDDTQQAQANGDEEREFVVVVEKLLWSEEMLEQLVEVLYSVFEEGGAADNSFKKSTFEKASHEVRKVYKGAVRVTPTHCKNK
jgi:hypothetical protein